MANIETGIGRVGYTEVGSGDGTPIIFLHGVGSDKTAWWPQLHHFGQSRRSIAFDYPGYGESDFRSDATRDDFAAAMIAAMDALSLEKAHICGLSLGGVIAIAMHAAAKARCASLIIADSFAIHPEGKAIYDRSVEACDDLRGLIEARIGALIVSEAQAVRTQVIETMAAIEPEAYRLGARAVWLADQRDRVAAIGVPTLVICGDRDAITPPGLSDYLVNLIRGSRLEIIAGASHLANLDKPAEFNRAVDNFLAEIEEQADMVVKAGSGFLEAGVGLIHSLTREARKDQ